jgi:hypothetical protein
MAVNKSIAKPARAIPQKVTKPNSGRTPKDGSPAIHLTRSEFHRLEVVANAIEIKLDIMQQILGASYWRAHKRPEKGGAA